jgi:hypothetical protein
MVKLCNVICGYKVWYIRRGSADEMEFDNRPATEEVVRDESTDDRPVGGVKLCSLAQNGCICAIDIGEYCTFTRIVEFDL